MSRPDDVAFVQYMAKAYEEKNETPLPVNTLLIARSNYDCCNSTDKYDEQDPETYLYEVYERVKGGVLLSDYLKEFTEGGYGGAQFGFATKASAATFLRLSWADPSASPMLHIKQGTPFGFISTWQGIASGFESVTTKDLVIPMYSKDLPEYNYWAPLLDSMGDKRLELWRNYRHPNGLTSLYGTFPTDKWGVTVEENA